MPSHTIHRVVMPAMKPFDAPDEFYPTAIQDFLVMVYLPENMKIKFVNCIRTYNTLYIF